MAFLASQTHAVAERLRGDPVAQGRRHQIFLWKE
jgi:hypothetical protein